MNATSLLFHLHSCTFLSIALRQLLTWLDLTSWIPGAFSTIELSWQSFLNIPFLNVVNHIYIGFVFFLNLNVCNTVICDICANSYLCSFIIIIKHFSLQTECLLHKKLNFKSKYFNLCTTISVQQRPIMFVICISTFS